MVLAKRKRTTWVSHLIQHHFLMKPSDEWLQKYAKFCHTAMDMAEVLG